MKKLICVLLLLAIFTVAVLPISAATNEAVTGEPENAPAPTPNAPAAGESDGFVWVNRTYELKATDFKMDFSSIFFRMWWQFGSTNAAADVAVREIQIWVNGEMLETHTGNSFSKIKVEGENENLPTVTRSDDGTVSVAGGTACKYDQLQFYTDGYNPLEKGDHTVTFRVLVRLKNVSDAWEKILSKSDNAFICNFWGEGLRGEYWLTAWDNNTIITKNECMVGSGNNEAFENEGNDGNDTTPSTPDQSGESDTSGGGDAPSQPGDTATQAPATQQTPSVTKPTTPANPVTDAPATPENTDAPATNDDNGKGCSGSVAVLPLLALTLCGTLPVFCRKKED